MTVSARRLEELAHGRRIAVAGVGHRLRGDDAVGSLIAERLRERGLADVFDVECVPENHFGALLDAHPGLVLFVDAADWGGAPGDTRLAPAHALTERCASTHALSLSLLAHLLEAHGVECWLAGIQPADLRVGAPLSPAVAAAARALESTLAACLSRPEAAHA